jgi:hypothetical protein
MRSECDGRGVSPTRWRGRCSRSASPRSPPGERATNASVSSRARSARTPAGAMASFFSASPSPCSRWASYRAPAAASPPSVPGRRVHPAHGRPPGRHHHRAGPGPAGHVRRPGPRSGARGHRHPVLVVNAATPTAFAWIVDRWGWPAARVALPASAGRLARDAGDGALVRASGAAGPSQLLTIGLIWRTIPASREPRRADWRGSGSRAAPSTFHTQGDIAWHNPHRRRRPAVTS